MTYLRRIDSLIQIYEIFQTSRLISRELLYSVENSLVSKFLNMKIQSFLLVFSFYANLPLEIEIITIIKNSLNAYILRNFSLFSNN